MWTISLLIVATSIEGFRTGSPRECESIISYALPKIIIRPESTSQDYLTSYFPVPSITKVKLRKFHGFILFQYLFSDLFRTKTLFGCEPIAS